MIVSEARIKANQANAKLSSGPSESGKARSARNSLKHGLTGAGIVVADQDLAEVDRRDEAFLDDLNPLTEVGKIYVRQMAVFSVRMDRSATQETAAIASNVRHAVENFDLSRLDEAEGLLDILGENPRVHIRKLRTSPEGVETLIGAWQDLKADLTRDARPIWTDEHLDRITNLSGRRVGAIGGSLFVPLSKAIRGDFSDLDPSEGAGLTDDDRKAWARMLLAEQIDAEIADLEAHFETLDFATYNADRNEAPNRAIFDPSKEATLARRYQSEATRGFFKALKDLRRVEKEFAERPIPVATPQPVEACAEEMGSFREPTPAFRRTLPESPRTPHPTSVSGTTADEIRPKACPTRRVE